MNAGREEYLRYSPDGDIEIEDFSNGAVLLALVTSQAESKVEGSAGWGAIRGI